MSLALIKLSPVQADPPDHHSTSARASTATATTAANPLPWWKRALDLTLCAAALPVLGITTFVMAAYTSIVSPGPVLFVQERIGYRGRRFMLYKFRTMHCGNDRSLHEDYCKNLIHTNAPMAKLDGRGDSRLFPGAWLLRALGLDEMPQLINVLRGEMSFVGPRPCLPSEFELYSPEQRERCAALPGLTGLWQVSGKNRTTFDQMIAFDVQYTRQLSLLLDLKIILMTAPSLFIQVLDIRQARSLATQNVPPAAAIRALQPPPATRPS